MMVGPSAQSSFVYGPHTHFLDDVIHVQDFNSFQLYADDS